MSKVYREQTGESYISPTSPEMRLQCQRPGKKKEDGTPLYFTEQHHKKECDVNLIIQKYDKTGLIQHISKFEGKFGDMTGLDFTTAQQQVANALSMFEELPANIKKRFKQSPAALLEFMENPANRDEAIKLGLIDHRWTEDSDGLGEHVETGKNKKKDEIEEVPAE